MRQARRRPRFSGDAKFKNIFPRSSTTYSPLTAKPYHPTSYSELREDLYLPMSPAQLEANRANAQLSTGPKTEAGRRRSGMNAFKHGITGKIHIATPEESAAFEAHCRSYVEALAPVGKLEDELALEIAEDKWRLKRIRSVESSIFAEGHSQYADEFASGNPQVDAAFAEGKTWTEQSAPASTPHSLRGPHPTRSRKE